MKVEGVKIISNQIWHDGVVTLDFAFITELDGKASLISVMKALSEDVFLMSTTVTSKLIHLPQQRYHVELEPYEKDLSNLEVINLEMIRENLRSIEGVHSAALLDDKMEIFLEKDIELTQKQVEAAFKLPDDKPNLLTVRSLKKVVMARSGTPFYPF